ncbi:hypothetical protein NVV94_12240 [Pseudomonas sp. LS1212]|uniref:hypothetical protein n=1 Tax=Pseudomonas sp. LS1212 TaxID=2972478 RepID=UPI00215C3EBC|nr:hypothetical protein [Pseudomonas sp. LS1212]UVJ46233.1 hypothetical protein NVV94_12240 [Pseudomonas sp. LS1212]
MTSPKNCARAVLAALGLMFLAQCAHALTWSDTFIGYRYGTDFTEPGVDEKIQKNVVQISHASGYALGQNFFNLDILKSDHHDPRKDSSSGAVEGYLVYRHQLYLSKVFDRSFAFGPVKEVAMSGGIELNYKNTAFATRKKLLVFGPTLKFDVPGFLDFSLLYAYEWNHCGLQNCTENLAFDPYYVVHAAWGIPFQLGQVPLRFQGFANYRTAKGEDYFKVKTTEETQVRTALMVDVGELALNRKNKVLVGLGYEYWRHKYGAHGKPGATTSAPMVQLEWHF